MKPLSLPAVHRIALISLLSLSALVGCSGSGPYPTQAAPRVTLQEYAEPSREVSGVPNFGKVADGIYRGGQPTRRGFQELEKMGIMTVVSLRRRSSNDRLLAGTGLRYFHISCEASRPQDLDVIQFLQIVTDPANQPVFVHCRRGADRTGYLVASYRMLVEGWNALDARAEMNHFRYNPLWWKLARYVRQFDPQKIRELIAASPAPIPLPVN